MLPLGVAAPLLAGCSDGVAVDPPRDALAAGADDVCADLSRRLPDVVAGAERRDTDPASARTAAWGDPAIVLRCGVAEPARFDPTAPAVEVNGVAWYLQQQPDGYRFTTLEREVRVEVVVPAAYAPEVNPLVDLAPAVSGAVPAD